MSEPAEADLREAQIRELFGMVRAIARRLARAMPAVDIGDLIGDGSVGLIRAVDGYDPARGVPLKNYARKMILGAMLNGVRKMDPVSERARRTIRLAEAARYAMAQQRGTLPPVAEMERITPGLDKALHVANRIVPLSLDARLSHEETGLLDRSSDPADAVMTTLTTAELREAIALLPPRQRRVVQLHYYNAMSIQAIGTQLNVSRQRASQLHLAALHNLRARIGTGAP